MCREAEKLRFRMIINKRFYFLIIFTLISLIGWLISMDIVLLSVWLTFTLILLSAYIMAKLALRGIHLKRISRFVKLEVGKIFNERIEISNISKTGKLWLQIEDHSGLLSSIQSRTITNLGAGKSRSFSTQALVNQRGFFPLGPTKVISGDPFGIFSVERIFPPEGQLTVYPHLERLKELTLEPGLEIGGQNLLIQTAQTTPQAAGVREYQPGDPLNRIHWPITVKKNRLMVKEFDEDTQSCVWLFLDAEADIYPHQAGDAPKAYDWRLLPINRKKVYKLPRDGFEYAVSVCASLARYYLRDGRAVGFSALGSKLNILPAEKGQRQLNKMLTKLAAIQDNGDLSIQTLIERQIKNIARGSSLVMITTQDINEIAASLELVRRWGLRAQVIQIDKASFYRNANDMKVRTIDASPSAPIKISKNLIRIAYGDEISRALSK